MKAASFFLFISVLFFSCGTARYAQHEPQIYQRAVENSMYPTAAKQAPLLSLGNDNPNLIRKTIAGEEHILMLTWKAKNYYPASGEYKTGAYEIWVTAAPELYQRMKKVKPADRPLRLKQLLGLPPTAENKIFIELWVKPADVFRPCPDKEVNDAACNLCFTAKDSADAEYITWFNRGRIDRYYATGLYNQYPWTQLGYTYDWHPRNRSHRGLSEFVIGKNKTIYIEKAYSTDEYLDSVR